MKRYSIKPSNITFDIERLREAGIILVDLGDDDAAYWQAENVMGEPISFGRDLSEVVRQAMKIKKL